MSPVCILLVDDEEMVREIAVMALEMDAYVVLTARSGYEAMEIVNNHPGTIHLALTDLWMQGMNGLELRERIISQRPETIVAVLSGDTYGGGIPDGVVTIQKPFTPLQLRDRVRQLLGIARSGVTAG